MLEKLTIGILLCIVGIQFILLKAALRRLRNLEKHCESWKLAAEHWEKEAHPDLIAPAQSCAQESQRPAP